MSYRGPDDSGAYVDQTMSLGHRRLSIIDLSSKGKQPMFVADRYVISFNGEIYNYRKIREELQEYTFQSETDTEVIV
jgi:asparagine synthase (glutamine-hydrolysing)